MARDETLPHLSRARPVQAASASPTTAGEPQPAQAVAPGTAPPITWLLAGALALLIIGWAAVIFLVEEARFAVVAPEAQVGVEAAAALARLFGALVLLLFPAETGGQRLHWVAGGFVVLALGGLFFGYLPPLLDATFTLNTAMYAWLVVRSVAGALFVVGLVPAAPPRLSRRRLLGALVIFGLLSLVVVADAGWLPPLAELDSLEAAAARGDTPLPGLTRWHWTLSWLPLGLALVAVMGAARQQVRERLGGWLLVAMILLAGSHLHNLFWPSAYSPVLTTADLLRLAFAAAVAVGGVLELRRIAAERAARLAAEREYSRRLAELAVLKADFTAMVAHELGSPLAAIRGLADMVATGALRPSDQASALAAIRTEVDLLTTLVADVQTAATVERDDFTVQARPVLVDALLAEAAVYARMLPGAHPVTTSGATAASVWADPDRIGQVLRNLLTNAAKYSPAGAPIELRARPSDGRLRLEVADHGPGIRPDELARIFEKFQRGRASTGRKPAGVGLGLYLSRRIVRAHGAELLVESTPGAGSVFAFELEVAP